MLRRTCVAVSAAITTILLPMQTVPAQNRAMIDAGEAVYNDYCFTCHGEKLVSSGQTFDLRRLMASDRARFENAVRMGKNQMPPWNGVLTSEQVEQIWLFVRDNAYQK